MGRRWSNNGITTPERHKESGDKVVAARGYRREGGATNHLDTKDMTKRNLTTASRETKRTREHEVARTRPEAILSNHGA